MSGSQTPLPQNCWLPSGSVSVPPSVPPMPPMEQLHTALLAHASIGGQSTGLWPPPPLPPVSDALYERLAALEADKVRRMAQESQRRDHELEMVGERLRSELQRMQRAYDEECERHGETRRQAGSASALQVELQRLKDERKKCLDAAASDTHRMQADLAMEKVERREAERRWQDTEVECQGLRARLDRSEDELNALQRRFATSATEIRQLQDETKRLHEELKLARDTQGQGHDRESAIDSLQKSQTRCHELEIFGERLQAELQQLQAVYDAEREHHSETRRRAGLADRLQAEVNMLKEQQQRHSDATASCAQRMAVGEVEELRQKLREADIFREQMESDYQHFKNADEERAKGEESLRESLTQERKIVKELTDRNALLELEVGELQARAKLQREGEHMRRMSVPGCSTAVLEASSVLAGKGRAMSASMFKPGLEAPLLAPIAEVVESRNMLEGRRIYGSVRKSIKADLTDSLDPVPLVPLPVLPPWSNRQIEIDLTGVDDVKSHSFNVDMIELGRIVY